MNKFIEIKGLSSINTKLRTLEAKLAKKVIGQAMRAAMKPMAGQVRTNAPRGATGKLAKSATVRAGKRKMGRISYRVVIGADKFPKFYAAFKALGTKKMDQDKFMLNAFQSRKSQALADAITGITAGVDAVVKGN